MLSSLVAFALLAGGQVSPQNFPDVSTEVDDVVVTAARPTWRVTVVVEGAEEEATMVVNDQIRCGSTRFQWGDLGKPRLCWARYQKERAIVLTPTSPGRDWAVDWTGCTAVRPTGECDVVLQGDTLITARFRRAG